MLIFREFFNTQSDQNILQNAPNCTTFSKFSLHENSHFLFKIISKYIPNASIIIFFKISSRE